MMNWNLKFETSGSARDPVAAVVNAVVPDPYAAPQPSPAMTFQGLDSIPSPSAGPLDNRPVLKLLLTSLLPLLLTLLGGKVTGVDVNKG